MSARLNPGTALPSMSDAENSDSDSDCDFGLIELGGLSFFLGKVLRLQEASWYSLESIIWIVYWFALWVNWSQWGQSNSWQRTQLPRLTLHQVKRPKKRKFKSGFSANPRFTRFDKCQFPTVMKWKLGKLASLCPSPKQPRFLHWLKPQAQIIRQSMMTSYDVD